MPNLTHHTLPNGLAILLREAHSATCQDDLDGGRKLDIHAPIMAWGDLEV
ncbi:MAG: hypothetical protein OXG23_08080 [Chloroflexi bacterium]|nr:hypothetical protein [Chloroflexota bacterium]